MGEHIFFRYRIKMFGPMLHGRCSQLIISCQRLLICLNRHKRRHKKRRQAITITFLLHQNTIQGDFRAGSSLRFAPLATRRCPGGTAFPASSTPKLRDSRPSPPLHLLSHAARPMNRSRSFLLCRRASPCAAVLRPPLGLGVIVHFIVLLPATRIYPSPGRGL
jgi:hypothetical protein